MLTIGLTGGIGSGKTTVANLFAARGITVIDTDQLARDVIQPGEAAYNQVVDAFGREIVMPDGQLDRRKMRKIVFKDAEKKQWLEKLLHPLIRQRMKQLIEQAKSPYCMVVIPLLFETESNPLIDRVLVVDAVEESQLQRAQVRDQVSVEDIKRVMESQVPRERRLAGAHDVIYNDGVLADLEPQVERLHGVYLEMGGK